MANVTKCINDNKGKEACSFNGVVDTKSKNSWPIRIKLTTDCMRWDSLKILPSKEFEEHFLQHMNESSRKDLNSWIPVNILIHDVDTCETYESKFSKKESFWFDPMPLVGEKCSSSLKSTMWEQPFYDLDKSRKEFVYSVEPFRHIIRKRDLKYDQEIGLRFSGGNVIVGFEFSVLNSSSLVDTN